MNFDRILMAGKVAAPVELRQTSRGTHAAKLSVEVQRRYRGANGERHMVVSVFDVGVYGEAAKNAAENLQVGDQVMIEGHHRLEHRRDPTGNDYTILRLAADFVDYVNNPKHKEECDA